jgi:hypothetical protein
MSDMNIDYYKAPPRGVKDRIGTVILYTEKGECFSMCKKRTITGFVASKERVETKDNPRGGRHYWHTVNERGERRVIRWDKVRACRNKGELEIIPPKRWSGKFA